MVNNRQKTMKKIIVSIIIAIFIFSIGSTFMLYMFWNQVETNTNNQSRTENSSNIGDNINLEFNNTENLETIEVENNWAEIVSESTEIMSWKNEMLSGSAEIISGSTIENTSEEATQLTWTESNEIENSESN